MITGLCGVAKKLKENEIVGERQRTLKFYFRPRWHPRGGRGICVAACKSAVITYNQSQDYVRTLRHHLATRPSVSLLFLSFLAPCRAHARTLLRPCEFSSKTKGARERTSAREIFSNLPSAACPCDLFQSRAVGNKIRRDGDAFFFGVQLDTSVESVCDLTSLARKVFLSRRGRFRITDPRDTDLTCLFKAVEFKHEIPILSLILAI